MLLNLKIKPNFPEGAHFYLFLGQMLSNNHDR